MKKVLLLGILFSFSATDAVGLYPVLDGLGSITDVFLSKGKLSKEHEKMFNEVAQSLGIEYRDIKARNSGLLLRLGFGYNNALAVQLTNRVYLN